jgi:murein DD-endopeptidase MepM/ murein hydrolase activator NlpD
LRLSDFSSLAAFVSDSLARHPKRVTGALAVLLLGTGVTAFGVVPLAPDAADLPVRTVLETIDLQTLAVPAGAREVPSFSLFRTDATRSTDTADSLLKRLGLSDAAAAAFLRSDSTARLLLSGRASKNVSVEASDSQQLLKLTARWSAEGDTQFQRLVIERSPKGLAARLETAPLVSDSRLAGATIQSSLFAAADEARIPDNVAVQLAEIFSGDIDFRRALRKGDRFNVVYETLQADGEILRSGKVLSAEFVNGGKAFQAMWFQAPEMGVSPTDAKVKAKGAYYTLDGKSLRLAYLTSPLEFSRVTSGFSMRYHPISRQWKQHLGTDFAAPTGTPARTVGDGVVDFAGVQNGYGNVVVVKHRNNHETLYAHLSQINVARGQTVSQGQTIGLVGSTGWSTGPHLHFEFKVAGVHQDPLTIAKQSETVPIAAAWMPQFRQLSQSVAHQLQAASSLIHARAE